MSKNHWERLHRSFGSSLLRHLVTLALLLLFLFTGQSSRLAIATVENQRSQDLWQDESPAGRLVPRRDGRRYLRLDLLDLRRLLEEAPLESLQESDSLRVELPVPMPGGSTIRFRLLESPVMEPALAARYPEIRTYSGQAIDDPAVTLRGDLTPQGFHATVLLADQTLVSIHPDPGADLRASRYISYFGTPDSDNGDPLVCEFRDPETLNGQPGLNLDLEALNYQSGETLRVYRIAIAASSEYTSTFGGGTTAGTVASLVTWLNGVNAIYERELTIRLQMIDAPTIIYSTERGFNSANDPFTNGSSTSMLSQLGQVMASIPTSSFDVGHVLGTGGGGVAYLGVVCRDSTISGGPVKGLGVTLVNGTLGNSGGLYVFSHELGHQFGAYHSFNGTGNNCGGGNRTGNSSFEPGSGMTIMSYAGNCGSDNIVFPGGGSLRFHIGSQRQIFAHLEGVGRCFVSSNTSNRAPTVSAGSDYTIPFATPFELRATGSDPDSADQASLTYVWEQVDAGLTYSNPPYSDSGDPITTTRPIFRSYAPLSSPSRLFPSLNYILNNANVPPETINGLRSGESLPAIGRILNFGVALRDNRAGGGGVAEDGVRLTVAGNAGPFRVTSPNTGVSWAGGSNQLVNWQVNNTNLSPVNCSQVRISLSTDGGQTFPVILNAATNNDGLETVAIPTGMATTQARIKVEAVGNIFFDISDANFTITTSASVNLPTLTGYTLVPATPVANLPFSGTVTGTNFVSGSTQVWFCVEGTASCSLLPAANVSVSSGTSLSLSGVTLAAGRWEAYLQTAAGVSNRSTSFTVQAAVGGAPVVTSFTWTPVSPVAGELFEGTINGSNFVAGQMRLFFCPGSSSACTEFDSTRLTFVSSTALRISRATLSAGSWQFYLQNQSGPSNRSVSFTVTSPAPAVPTITSYTWTPTPPVAGTPFSGSITGTNLVTGATQVFFCLQTSNSCTAVPASAVTVTSTTSMTLTGVTLEAGSWQFYLQNSNGNSTRSATFIVEQAARPVPQISSYSWNPATPITGRPFTGTVSGDNFDPTGTRIFFCQIGRPICVRQAGVVITVNSPTTLQLSNVVLAAGNWQFYLQTSAGNSTRSTSFNVQVATLGPPTITGYSFNPVDPRPDQPFNLSVSGSGFVPGSTRVFICAEGPEEDETCIEIRQSSISVPTQALLVAESLSLGAGRWQIKVETPAGLSPRSAVFTIQAGQSTPPRITSIARNPVVPVAGQPFTLTVIGEGYLTGATRLFTCLLGAVNCAEVSTSQISVTNSTSLVASGVTLAAGTWQVYVQTTNGASSRSVNFTIGEPPTVLPTITSLTLDKPVPLANQPFQITLTGTGFVSGSTRVFYCLSGRTICTEAPAASVIVSGTTSLRLSDVQLIAGEWQIQVQTSSGTSARSAAFTVRQSTLDLPTLISATWSPATPEASRPFAGRLVGTNFSRDSSSVFFCPESPASVCLQAAPGSVNVVDQNTIDLTSLSLPGGKWQVFVRTTVGDSNRSSTFEVVVLPGNFPTITGYLITPTVPRANVNFKGTISGTNFELTTTRVYFCQSGTNKCQVVPPENVTVTSATSLTFVNVKLPRASWQIYVQTNVAWTDRTRQFLVL